MIIKLLSSCCLAAIISGCATTSSMRTAATSELATEPGIVLELGYQPAYAPVGSPDYPAVFPTKAINVKIYKDVDETLAAYKTFDFDYTNKANPLLEKELFHQLEQILQENGMRRAKEDPQILISMDFFIGKKEQYTPPTTITSTQLQTVWNTGMIGWDMMGYSSQVPVTSSTTTPGYTTISYYTNIRLNFLNRAKLMENKKIKTPPLLWIGEADNEGTNSDIRDVAPSMFGELAGEFPDQVNKAPTRYVRYFRYGGLGLGFDPEDWRVVSYVEPSSIADKQGIKPGDVILKIHGKDTRHWTTYSFMGTFDYDVYRANDPYFLHILSNHGDEEVKLVIKSAETKKRIRLRVTPNSEARYIHVNSSGIPII
ncbi:MAG: DUF4136 domain-containing protein [Pseudomonadota bacterium]